MANKLLKTLTIDGVPNDALGVGNFLKLDAQNGAEIPVESFSVLRKPDSVNLPNNAMTDYNILTITEKALYLFFWHIEFTANATGSRYISIRLTRNSTNTEVGGAFRTSAAPTGVTMLAPTVIQVFEPGDIISVRCYQNSGATLKVAGSYNGIKIAESST